MVRSLPIAEGDRVLEMACGDGAYTPWLAKKVGDAGKVVGLDVSTEYLKVAKQATRNNSNVRFVAGSIDRLPFEDGAFDVAWCAQSLFSLPEPVDAVRRMARVVKPGGLVAVLEDDTMHQVLLPWPVDVELAVRLAEWQSLVEESDEPPQVLRRPSARPRLPRSRAGSSHDPDLRDRPSRADRGGRPEIPTSVPGRASRKG